MFSRNYFDQSLRVTQRVIDPNRYIIYLNEEKIDIKKRQKRSEELKKGVITWWLSTENSTLIGFYLIF